MEPQNHSVSKTKERSRMHPQCEDKASCDKKGALKWQHTENLAEHLRKEKHC